MSLNATVKARCEMSVKVEAETILKEIGLNTSQAINLFLKRIIIENGIPFELKIPNDATLKAMQEAKNMDGDILTLDNLKQEKSFA